MWSPRALIMRSNEVETDRGVVQRKVMGWLIGQMMPSRVAPNRPKKICRVFRRIRVMTCYVARLLCTVTCRIPRQPPHEVTGT